MTSTEKVLTTVKERRTEWIALFIEAAAQIPNSGPTRLLWESLLQLMLREARGLMGPGNQWWLRRIHWIESSIELGRDPRFIVIHSLAAMKTANDNDGR